jgi:hypothetical protein
MRRILDARWTNWRTIAGIWAVAKLPGAPEESARFDAPTRGWLWHDRPENLRQRGVQAAVLAERLACAKAVCPACHTGDEPEPRTGLWWHVAHEAACEASRIWDRGGVSPR